MRCCTRWRTGAGGRCWRCCGTIRRRRASWPTCCRSPGPGCPGTCGCCGRPGWSTSAGRAAAGLQPAAGATGRGGHLARPVPGAVGAAAAGPAHRGRPRKTRSEGARHDRSDPDHGSLRRLDDGRGAVRMEDLYDTGIEDLWSAVTDPDRLARWVGQVTGDFRPGGRIDVRFTSS